MTTKITLQQLAIKINGNIWEKGDLKRIYLEKGNNTKKMSTKAYVYQNEAGEFQVSCKVECPSQPWQWCKSQEEEVKTSVMNSIENIIKISSLTLVKYKHLEESEGFMVFVKEGDNEPKWYTEELFYQSFEEYPENVFPEYQSFYDEIQTNKPTPAPVVQIKKETPIASLMNTATPTYGAGSRVFHPKFGEGTVTIESEKEIHIQFDKEEAGFRQLLKSFAKLSLVES